MSAQVLVRMDEDLGAAVAAAAAATGLSPPAWLRDLAADRLTPALGAAAASARRPSGPRRRQQLAADDVAAASRLAAWVSRLNGAVVQLTAGEREAGHAEAHVELEALLRDLREAQRALVVFVERLS